MEIMMNRDEKELIEILASDIVSLETLGLNDKTPSQKVKFLEKRGKRETKVFNKTIKRVEKLQRKKDKKEKRKNERIFKANR